MSDQATGGDGSVRWSVDADSVHPGDIDNTHTGGDPGPHHQHGISLDGDVGGWFTVSIKVPAEIGSVNDYVNAIKAGVAPWGVRPDPRSPNRVCLNVRIERKNHDQIRVSWGNSANLVGPDEGFAARGRNRAARAKVRAKPAPKRKRAPAKTKKRKRR